MLFLHSILFSALLAQGPQLEQSRVSEKIEASLSPLIPKDLRQRLTKKHLQQAINQGIQHSLSLKHFQPWQLLSIQVSDPHPHFSERFPSFRVNFVWNPQTNSLNQLNKRWIAEFRKTQPLALEKLTPIPLSEYLKELLLMAPLVGQSQIRDFEVFQISSSTFQLSYRFTNSKGQADSSSVLLTTDKYGGIEGVRRRGALPEADPDLWFID